MDAHSSEGEGSLKELVKDGRPKHWVLQQTLLAPDPGGFPNTVHAQAQNLLVALAHVVPDSTSHSALPPMLCSRL